MPIYEYRCGECEQVFEALQRVHDEPLDTCRRCGGPAERIISSPAIHFVGSGWYVTDYARKGKDEGRESKSDDRGEGKGKEGKKAESGGEAGGSSAGAAKNGRSSGGESSGKGNAAGRGSGSGGKTADARTERRAGAAT